MIAQDLNVVCYNGAYEHVNIPVLFFNIIYFIKS